MDQYQSKNNSMHFIYKTQWAENNKNSGDGVKRLRGGLGSRRKRQNANFIAEIIFYINIIVLQLNHLYPFLHVTEGILFIL